MSYTYALTNDSTIIERSDGLFIPNTDPNNIDYQGYLSWVALGNTVSAAPTPISVPNPIAFLLSVKSILGGIIAADTILSSYSAFAYSVILEQWADVQTIIIAANTASAFTSTQYTNIKSAVITYNIPITLP